MFRFNVRVFGSPESDMERPGKSFPGEPGAAEAARADGPMLTPKADAADDADVEPGDDEEAHQGDTRKTGP